MIASYSVADVVAAALHQLIFDDRMGIKDLAQGRAHPFVGLPFAPFGCDSDTEFVVGCHGSCRGYSSESEPPL